MTTHLSLTARLSLLFMLAVTSVLALAGLLFNQLSQHHFDELDRRALADKLDAAEQLLLGLGDLQRLDAVQPQLYAMLGGHRDLAVLILDGEARILFSVPEQGELAEPFRQLAARGEGEWQRDGRLWRGAARAIERDGQRLSVLLMLDVTTHQVFFHTLAGWLWAALLLFALLSALLGWMLSSNGLRPLRDVTQVIASVSARSLTERIPTQSVPAELLPLVLAFNAMLARLEESFVRLSNFSADIAHELRTPVSNLLTHTEVVLSRARSLEDYQDNLHSNLEELRRMARMIDDMLFLAKADNGLIIPERQPVDLRRLCASLLEFYELAAEERGVRFELSGSATLHGDALMLRRALSNLLSNALRYTPDGASIRLSLQQTERTVCLSLANPGGTIAAEHLERLFDRFYRGDPARREGHPGNAGLGLAITRSIVEAHRGQIRCRSADGWTTFELEFRV